MKKPKRMVNINGVEMEFNKLPKAVRDAINKKEKEIAKAKSEAEELAKPVKLDINKIGERRKELAPFAGQLSKLLDELAHAEMKFDSIRRDGGEMYGEMKGYKIAATLEYTDELFPKPCVLFKARNVAEGDNVIDHACSAFVHKNSHQIYQNQLIDYILGERPGNE
jgi:hypothetical protein